MTTHPHETPPPLGLCCEVSFHSVRDGDTPVVKLRTGQLVAVRLIDCWAPETNEPGGPEATRFLADLLGDLEPGELRLHLPPPKDADGNGVLDVVDLLKAQTFDRVPGWLWIQAETNRWQNVSQVMVRHDHATPTRRKEPRE